MPRFSPRELRVLYAAAKMFRAMVQMGKSTNPNDDWLFADETVLVIESAMRKIYPRIPLDDDAPDTPF